MRTCSSIQSNLRATRLFLTAVVRKSRKALFSTAIFQKYVVRMTVDLGELTKKPPGQVNYVHTPVDQFAAARKSSGSAARHSFS